MQVMIETVTGIQMKRNINISDSPMAIVRQFYEDDETAASQIFSNEMAVSQLMSGNVDEAKSAFELIDVRGDSIRASWKDPLCNQPSIKEALAALEAKGEVPVFVVCVSSIVA